MCDDQLFAKVTGNCQHLLHDLLPPIREQYYGTLSVNALTIIVCQITLQPSWTKTFSLEYCIKI